MLSEAQLILTGLGVGLITAAPVGPVNIMSIHCNLERGLLAGLAAGVGAVLADGLLALLAASGVTYISGVMVRYRQSFQLIGGLVLALFALRLFVSHPHDKTKAEGRREADGWVIPKTFFLTLTNPGAVLGMFALIGSATSAIGIIDGRRDVMLFVLAVMAGGLLWWLLLNVVVARLAHRIDDRQLRRINVAAGFVLLGFGAFLLIEVVIGSFGRSTH